MNRSSAVLALANGAIFHGRSIGYHGRSVGEVVFNTAMTGYQEILSDPSYARQIVTLTYPHIGNTGANSEDMEAGQVHCAGLVVRDLPRRVSNWRAEYPLQEFLQLHRITAIADIDTRRLTRILREEGAQGGCILAGDAVDEATALGAARDFPGIQNMDLAAEVSTSEPYLWDGGSWTLAQGYGNSPDSDFKVVAYDFGVKHNILRMLSDRGCSVQVVPAKTPASVVLADRPDGVFLSNGPGDPEPCGYAIDAIREIVETRTPVFGICLGHQLLALACGGATMKMKFGHHGANHPVQDLVSGQVMITSQNHGFAVREDTLPGVLRVTHRSLFDGTVQGLAHLEFPAFSFQGHPEASPGPHDLSPLFDQFIRVMHSHRSPVNAEASRGENAQTN